MNQKKHQQHNQSVHQSQLTPNKTAVYQKIMTKPTALPIWCKNLANILSIEAMVKQHKALSILKPTCLRLGMMTIGMCALSSCSSINAYKTTPNIDVTAYPNIPITTPYETLDKKTVSNEQTRSIATKRWTEFYDDAKLKALIDIALRNNKDFKLMLHNIEQVGMQYQITQVQDIPSVVGQTGVTRSANHALDKNPSNRYNIGLGLSNYEVDFWGRIASLKGQAFQTYLATKAGKESAQIILVSNLAQTYVNLSYAMAQQQLAEATVASRKKSLSLMQARFNAGVDDKTPSLQSQAALENAKTSVYDATTQILKLKNAMRLLLGVPNIPEEFLPTPAISNLTSDNIYQAGLPSELLLYRPDILQAEHSLKAAGSNVLAARAAYFPVIQLSSQVGFASGELKNLFQSSSFSWSFGPSISIPLIDAGRLDANYEVAKIAQQKALTTYEKTIQTAFREVSDVLAERATLEQKLTSQYKLQDVFQETHMIAMARFKAGLTNYLSVLDAQRSLFANQQGILALEQQKLLTQIRLYQVLGGGSNIAYVAQSTPTSSMPVEQKQSSLNNHIPKNAMEATDEADINADINTETDDSTSIDNATIQPIDITSTIETPELTEEQPSQITPVSLPDVNSNEFADDSRDVSLNDNDQSLSDNAVISIPKMTSDMPLPTATVAEAHSNTGSMPAQQTTTPKTPKTQYTQTHPTDSSDSLSNKNLALKLLVD